MRVWDVDPSLLCKSHLLGEHAEVHGVAAVIKGGRLGYQAHPEVHRWRGKLPALKKRHDALVLELGRRGYRHASPMPMSRGRSEQDVLLATVPEQLALLAAKGCFCLPSGALAAVVRPPKSSKIRRLAPCNEDG